MILGSLSLYISAKLLLEGSSVFEQPGTFRLNLRQDHSILLLLIDVQCYYSLGHPLLVPTLLG